MIILECLWLRTSYPKNSETKHLDSFWEAWEGYFTGNVHNQFEAFYCSVLFMLDLRMWLRIIRKSLQLQKPCHQWDMAFALSQTPKHANTPLFCSCLKCLSQASPSPNFRKSADANRNVLHWLWKFIFGAANLYLAEDGEVMIAADINQLTNFLSAVYLPWE